MNGNRNAAARLRPPYLPSQQGGRLFGHRAAGVERACVRIARTRLLAWLSKATKRLTLESVETKLCPLSWAPPAPMLTRDVTLTSDVTCASVLAHRTAEGQSIHPCQLVNGGEGGNEGVD